MSRDPFEIVVASAIDHVEQTLGYMKALAKGDTPIEKLLSFAIDARCRYGNDPVEGVAFCRTSEVAAEMMGGGQHDNFLLILPQAQVGDWRVDFLVHARSDIYGTPGPWKTAIVECDGHDFHERTKDQAAKDRSRDRRSQLAGTPVFRFTGSELWRDPCGCAAQVVRWAYKTQYGGIL